MSRLDEINAKIAELEAERRKLYATDGKQILQLVAEPLFALGVKAFTWKQYTPYFNDGEPCYFSVYADDLNVTFPSGVTATAWDVKYYLEPYKAPSYARNQQAEDRYRSQHEAQQAEYIAAGLTVEFADQVDAASSEISSVLHKNEDMLEQMFGDHVRVTMRSDGEFEVEEYDHD